jgi:hypothetical protein
VQPRQRKLQRPALARPAAACLFQVVGPGIGLGQQAVVHMQGMHLQAEFGRAVRGGVQQRQ